MNFNYKKPRRRRNFQDPPSAEDHDSPISLGKGSRLQPFGPAEPPPKGRSTDSYGPSHSISIDREYTGVSPVDVLYTDPGYILVPKDVFDRQRILGSLESDELLTEYSDASSISDTERNAYVYELADDLFGNFGTVGESRHKLKEICDDLPGLLKTFALRFGHHASTQMHIDVMHFVHMHHR